MFAYAICGLLCCASTYVEICPVNKLEARTQEVVAAN